MSDSSNQGNQCMCYAPTFKKAEASNRISLIFSYSAILVILFILWALTLFLSKKLLCLIKQYRFRIKRIDEGNNDPNICLLE